MREAQQAKEKDGRLTRPKCQTMPDLTMPSLAAPNLNLPCRTLPHHKAFLLRSIVPQEGANCKRCASVMRALPVLARFSRSGAPSFRSTSKPASSIRRVSMTGGPSQVRRWGSGTGVLSMGDSRRNACNSLRFGCMGFGSAWSGTARHGAFWLGCFGCGMDLCGTARWGSVRHTMVRRARVRSGTVRYGLEEKGTEFRPLFHVNV